MNIKKTIASDSGSKEQKTIKSGWETQTRPRGKMVSQKPIQIESSQKLLSGYVSKDVSSGKEEDWNELEIREQHPIKYKKTADAEKNPLACVHWALYCWHGSGILPENQKQLNIKNILTYEPKKLDVDDIQEVAYYFVKGIINEVNAESCRQYMQLYRGFRDEYYASYCLDIERYLIENLPESSQYSMDLFEESLCNANNREEEIENIYIINKVLKNCTAEKLLTFLQYCFDVRKLKLNIGKHIINLILCKKPDITFTKKLIDSVTKPLASVKNNEARQRIEELKKVILTYRTSIELLRASICRSHKLELASELINHSKTEYEDLVILLKNWIPSIDDPLKLQERINRPRNIGYSKSCSELLKLVGDHLDIAKHCKTPSKNIENALNFICECLKYEEVIDDLLIKILNIINNKNIKNHLKINISEIEIGYLCIYYTQIINSPLESKSKNKNILLINSLNLKNLTLAFTQESPSPFPEVRTLTRFERIQLAFVYAYEGTKALIPSSAAYENLAFFLLNRSILKVLPKEFQNLNPFEFGELIEKYIKRAQLIKSTIERD